MAVNPPPGDLGIVLNLKGGAPLGTYTTIKGVSTARGTLGAAYVAGVTFNPGVPRRMTLAVIVTLSGATSVTVKLEGRRFDSLNASLFDQAWAAVQTTRSDTGTTTFEHTFTADGQYFLQTESHGMNGECQVSGKAVLPQVGSIVTVGGNVG